jgi:outer membrane lipoprotein-sorting protein
MGGPVLRKINLVPIASAFALLLTVGTAHAGKLATSGYFEAVQSASNVDASQNTTTKVCWKNGSWRSEEYSVAGLRVTIKKGNVLYQYSPEQKMAMKLPVTTGVPVDRLLTELLQPYQLGAKVGSTTVNGVRCDLRKVSVKGASKALNATAAVSTNPQFAYPMRLQIKQGSLSETIEVRALNLSPNIRDSLFTLPQGTKIIQPKKMSGKMPGRRGKAHK